MHQVHSAICQPSCSFSSSCLPVTLIILCLQCCINTLNNCIKCTARGSFSSFFYYNTHYNIYFYSVVSTHWTNASSPQSPHIVHQPTWPSLISPLSLQFCSVWITNLCKSSTNCNAYTRNLLLNCFTIYHFNGVGVNFDEITIKLMWPR